METVHLGKDCSIWVQNLVLSVPTTWVRREGLRRAQLLQSAGQELGDPSAAHRTGCVLWKDLHAKVVRAANDLHTAYQTLCFHFIDTINLQILKPEEPS